LRSVKDTKDDKPGNLFYVPGEMLKRDGSSGNILFSSKRTEDILIKVGVISERLGDLEECEVYLKQRGPSNEGLMHNHQTWGGFR
jgi:hypothetical protein